MMYSNHKKNTVKGSTAKSAKNVYQFKVTLKGIKPAIWRRVQVLEDYNFYNLHRVIQDSMGWNECHLHEFRMPNPDSPGEIVIGPQQEDDFFFVPEIRVLERKAKISKYFPVPKTKAVYTYDFGDGWTHDVVLEKILPQTSGAQYPVCVGGRRACPPEDCGGTYGYANLLKTIANPDDPEHNSMMDWLDLIGVGRDYDPAKFDPKDVEFDLDGPMDLFGPFM